MYECKGVKILMFINGYFGTDENGKGFDQQVYRFMIGFLLYLCVFRSDIMFSVCMCVRF